MSKNLKSRCFAGLVYPESADIEVVKQLLIDSHLSFCVSPLHDRDCDSDGVVKKAHYHVCVLWDGPTTVSVASSVFESVGLVGCIACRSIKGYLRYLTHMDDKDKFQYDRDDVFVYGVDYDTLVRSESDDVAMLKDIYRYIVDNGIVNYSDFILSIMSDHDDWFTLASTSFRENIYRFIWAFAHKA